MPNSVVFRQIDASVSRAQVAERLGLTVHKDPLNLLLYTPKGGVVGYHIAGEKIFLNDHTLSPAEFNALVEQAEKLDGFTLDVAK